MKAKTIDKIKKFVTKKYPTAKSAVDTNGRFFVSDENGKLMSEYYIPNQKKLYDAWLAVYDIIKIDQNIQRTHPDRMDLSHPEEKLMRMQRRRRKNDRR